MAADPRFHGTPAPQPLSAVAAAAGAPLDAGDTGRLFRGVAPLDSAGAEDVSYLDHPRYRDALCATGAGAVVLTASMAEHLPPGAIGLITPTPAVGFARIAALFHPPSAATIPGIHPTAAVADDAEVDASAEIGPFAVVGGGARIGPGCVIGPHVTVGPGVELGEGCRLHAHSSISHAIAGRGVVLHPGARVGQEGFGFTPTPDGQFVTMPQLGRVLLGDRVEIGANACVDRGAQGDTVLGAGTRLDNLVMIGHNVRIGRGGIVVSQAGISGSTRLGDFVVVAAQAGLIGHLAIGDRARIGAQAGVIADVAAGHDVLGSPAWPVRETWRAIAQLRRLARRGAKPGA